MKQRAQQKTKFGVKNHRLGLNDQVDVTFGLNFLYTGSFYFGESDQEMDLIYDTGSDWMTVEGRDCENCLGSRYDPNTSSYFVTTDLRTQEKTYGDFAHIEGKEVQD